MATLGITRRFEVAAPPERVWRYLTTPRLIVRCLPGAVLLSSSDDGRSHEGTVTVKLGAMSMSYKGVAEFEEVDDEAYKLRVRAKGREWTGAGSAEMTMQAVVEPQEAGVSAVSLEATASVSGKIVTLGRGMIDIVSEQVLSEFSTCLSEKLASPEGDASGDAGAAGSSDGAGGASGGTAAPPDAPSSATPAQGPSVSALGLLWRALNSWVRRLFGGS